MIDDDDFDRCSVWTEDVVIARKIHCCNCCGGDIHPGRPYSKHFSVSRDGATYEKMCGPCSIVVEAFMDDHGTRTSPGGMHEIIAECAAEGDEDSRRWLFASLAMTKRYRARQARLSLTWRPALPPKGARHVHA